MHSLSATVGTTGANIPVTKLYILREIKRTTQANGGKPLRKTQFESETGITRFEWFGVYWARWSDALREAGCGQIRIQRRVLAASPPSLKHHPASRGNGKPAAPLY